MGALTENRKSVNEFCTGSLLLPRPYPFDPAVDLPTAKRPRLAPSTVLPAASEPPSEVSSFIPKAPVSRIRQFPPPAPLRRAVHAPQRNSRFARAVPAVKPLSVKEDGGVKHMGGLFSRLRQKTDLKQFDWIDETGGKYAAKHNNRISFHAVEDSCEGLTVQEYKELVEKHESLSALLRKYEQVVQSSVVTDSDLTLLTPEKPVDKDVAGPSVVDLVPLNDLSEEKISYNDSSEEKITGTPAYKSLLETSRSRDSKLEFLNFEVELFEKKFSAFKLIERKPVEETKEKRISCSYERYIYYHARNGDNLFDVTRELFTPLTEDEEDVVSQAFVSRNRREVLVAHESSNIEITREILQCLGPNSWLNDEVINLYLELLKERERRDAKKFLKCHFFNTFFYKKLIGGRGGYDFKAVKRWTTQRKLGYSLIDCDKIFVPIHKEIHWCLAVINIQDKKFQYLDSLGGRDLNVPTVLAKYLIDEARDKSNNDIDISSWTQEFVDDLPEQKNGWDCGVFMIKYADFYSRGLSLSFSQDHMPYFRMRTAKEILYLKAE